MGWWRREEEDNPAWPGLVDIFAFTLVFVMLLWFGTDWREEKKNLEEELNRLRNENAAFQKAQQLAQQLIDAGQ